MTTSLKTLDLECRYIVALELRRIVKNHRKIAGDLWTAPENNDMVLEYTRNAWSDQVQLADEKAIMARKAWHDSIAEDKQGESK